MKSLIKKTSIEGLFLIEKPIFFDQRGFFHEIFRRNELEKVIDKEFNPVQWNHSFSLPGVIRGIHTEEWQKVIYPVTGKIFAAFVDVRESSRTFAKVETFIFDCTKRDSPYYGVYISPGIGNSLCVIGGEPAHYMYLVDEYWEDGKARGIAWDDPDLAINWPIKNPILSERDRKNPTLREIFPEKFKSL